MWMNQQTRIKVCGLTEPAQARALAQAGGHAIGLVFAKGSPRQVEVHRAGAIAKAAGPFVEVVGLFVDHTVTQIEQVAGAVGLTMIQLHGDYGVEEIKALAPRRVLRAVHFQEEAAEDVLRMWQKRYHELENLIGLLVDTPDAKVAGGTGRSFDWAALRSVLDGVGLRIPLVLAGGLDAKNVAHAIQVVKPWAVDVSSGVEIERGVKDIELIRAFCEAVI